MVFHREGGSEAWAAGARALQKADEAGSHCEPEEAQPAHSQAPVFARGRASGLKQGASARLQA